MKDIPKLSGVESVDKKKLSINRKINQSFHSVNKSIKEDIKIEKNIDSKIEEIKEKEIKIKI